MHPKEKIVYNILNQLKPDRDALLKLILSKISDETLMDIAKADYGWKAEENIIALRKLKSTHIIPTNKELDYEVLGLYRHTEPGKYQELKIDVQHLGRALSCVILFIAESFADDNNYYNPCAMENTTYNLIQLIESVNYLGKNFQLALICFLTWQLSEDRTYQFFYEDEVNNIFPIFALIYLLLKTCFSIREDQLKILVECLIEGAEEVEGYYKNNSNAYKEYSIEFLGVFNPQYQSVERYDKWINLAKEIPALITDLKDQELIHQLTETSVLISKNEHLYKKN